MIKRILVTALLVVGAVIFLFPFYFMFIGSFKTTNEIFSMAIMSLPKEGFRFTNYVGLFVMSAFGRSLLNSGIVSVSYIVLILFFSSLAGFAFAKYRFPGKETGSLGIENLSSLSYPQNPGILSQKKARFLNPGKITQISFHRPGG